jgi:glycosyltransferase involved in cell wall biosynthesis
MEKDNSILSFISSTTGGGAEFLVRDLHKRYKANGFASKVFYFSGESNDLDSDEKVMNVQPRSPLNIIRIRREIKSQLQLSKKCLVVHAHLTWPFFYVALASIGLKNIVLIYTEHNTNNRRRCIPLFKYIDRILYSRYSRIICISNGVYNSLRYWVGDKLAEKLSIVPNGARMFGYKSREPLSGRLPRLVSVGSLTYKKNFITIVRSLSHLKSEFENYTIVGEGVERPKLERLICDLDLTEKVRLVGWSDSIEAYFSNADIQLIPSLWEGFGLVAVEGMSTGLPVVASNLDGLREVLDPRNVAVELVDNVESSADWGLAIQKILRRAHEKGTSVLAKSARIQAEKFDMDKMVDGYLSVYKEVMNENSACA